MNGPSHYREAEQLLEQAHVVQADSGPGCGSEEIIAEAQVHATLALAAATAMANRQNPDGPPGMDLDDQAAWDAVAKDAAW